MVIVTFSMDSTLYPDLLADATVAEVTDNFRHMVRVNKGHPAILMWAISNEPNAPDVPASYAGTLGSFFQFLDHLKEVRDDEEDCHNYHPHPLLVPMADTDAMMAEVQTYDNAQHNVWGVQVVPPSDPLVVPTQRPRCRPTGREAVWTPHRHGVDPVWARRARRIERQRAKTSATQESACSSGFRGIEAPVVMTRHGRARICPVLGFTAGPACMCSSSLDTSPLILHPLGYPLGLSCPSHTWAQHSATLAHATD